MTEIQNLRYEKTRPKRHHFRPIEERWDIDLDLEHARRVVRLNQYWIDTPVHGLLASPEEQSPINDEPAISIAAPVSDRVHRRVRQDSSVRKHLTELTVVAIASLVGFGMLIHDRHTVMLGLAATLVGLIGCLLPWSQKVPRRSVP